MSPIGCGAVMWDSPCFGESVHLSRRLGTRRAGRCARRGLASVGVIASMRRSNSTGTGKISVEFFSAATSPTPLPHRRRRWPNTSTRPQQPSAPAPRHLQHLLAARHRTPRGSSTHRRHRRRPPDRGHRRRPQGPAATQQLDGYSPAVANDEGIRVVILAAQPVPTDRRQQSDLGQQPQVHGTTANRAAGSPNWSTNAARRATRRDPPRTAAGLCPPFRRAGDLHPSGALLVSLWWCRSSPETP